MVSKYSFENFIMQCCKSDEKELRKFLKKVLSRAGFTITEDDYRSSKNDVPNMLAVRGNPKVCLLAHTDTCREHKYMVVQPTPEIKIKEIYGEEKFIIQDKNCKTQLGGDDRLGVAINTWIALNTGYDMGLLFLTDEEIGVVSSSHLHMEEINQFDLLIQTDRGNKSNELVSRIMGLTLCSGMMVEQLLKISREIGLPRKEVNGFLTDVYALKENGKYKMDMVNMTIGYHNSIGDQPDEYIDIQEARETLQFVSEIVKRCYLNELIFKNNDYDDEEINSYNRYISVWE